MIDKFFKGTEALLERLTDSTTTKPDCNASIICECGRRNCYGTTLAVTTYVRRIKAVK